MEAAWRVLEAFAQGEHQRLWILAELERNPPAPGQDPYTWLLWRSKVSEGMSEVDAWESVVQAAQAAKSPVPEPMMSPRAHQQQRVDEGIMLNGAVSQQGYGNPTYVAPQPIYPSVATYAEPTIALSDLHTVNGARVPAQQYSYVQTNDILPLPSAPVMFDDTEDAIGSPYIEGLESGSRSASASPGSSQLGSDGSNDDDDVDELDEDVKPTIVQLPAIQSALPIVPSISHPTPFDFGSARPQPSRIINRTVKVNPRPAADWSKLFPTYTTSPYARSLNLLEQRNRPRLDSSSIDKPRPRPARPVPRAPPAALAPDPINAVPQVIDMPFIRTLITPQRLKEDKPVALWKYLRRLDRKDEGDKPPRFEPSPTELREIVHAIWMSAPPDYKQKMADNYSYAEQIARWLKAMNKDVYTWEVAIAPLIMLLASTDITVDVLTDLSIGKAITLIAKKAKAENLSNVSGITSAFERWKDHCTNKILAVGRTLATPRRSADAGDKSANGDISTTQPATSRAAGDSTEKKPTIPSRPATAGGPSKTASTSRNVPAAAPASNSGLKRSVPAIPSTASSAASSMSFFGGTSATAPPSKRPKVLPSFKKGGTSGTIAPGAAAGASVNAPPPTSTSTSLLAATLARVNAASSGSSPISRAALIPSPSGVSSGVPAVKQETKVKLNKKGHTVRFRDEVPDGGVLEEKLIFREEIWELEKPFWLLNEDGTDVHGANPHDLDIKEGMTLKKEMADHREQVVEQLVEWYPPSPYNDSPLEGPTPDALAQEERERGILASAGGAPPDESSVRVVPPTAGKLYELPAALVAAPVPVQQTVSQLLSNLSNIGSLGNIGFGLQPPAPGLASAGLLPQAAPPPAQNYYNQASNQFPAQLPGPAGFGGQYGGYQSPAQQQHQWQAGPPHSSGAYNQPADQGWNTAGVPRGGGGWSAPGEYDRGQGGSGANYRNGGGSNRSGGTGGGGQGRYRNSKPCDFFAKG